MKRFFDENGDLHYNDDDDDDDDFEEEEYDEDGGRVESVIHLENSVTEMLKLDLIEMEQRTKLLEHATKIAQQDLYWYFRKPSTKLKRISKIFHTFENLIYSSHGDTPSS